MILSVGFESIPSWECCLLHRELKIALSVYVDDFKMAGTPSAVGEAWERIKTVIKLGEPTLLGKYLGCNHTMCEVPSSWVDSESTQSLLRDGSDDLEPLAENGKLKGTSATTQLKGTSTQPTKMQRGIKYDMHGSM